jgi:hypothetical protein
MFLQKPMSKAISKKNDKGFERQFLSRFLSCRGCGCSSAMGVQKHHKGLLPKKYVEKILQNNRQTTNNPAASRFFVALLGVSRRGSSKTPQTKLRKNWPWSGFGL